MRRTVIAFILGTLAGVVAVMVAAIAVATLLEAGGRTTLEVALGPLEIYSYGANGSGAAMHLGPGALLVVVAAGMLNAFAAHLLRRRVTAARH